MTAAAPLVALHIANLEGGGAERVCLTLAEHLLRRGYRVDLVLVQARGALLKDAPQGAGLVDLNARGSALSLQPLIGYLKNRRPDVMIAGLVPQNTLAVLAARLSRTAVKVFVTQHAVLSSEVRSGWSPWRWLAPLLYRWALPRASGVIAVSSGVAHDMHTLTGFAASHVIYNPVEGERAAALAHAPLPDDPFFTAEGPLILGAGRLAPVKGFDTLIAAFAVLAKSRQARLAICGAGPLEAELRAQIARQGLQERVRLLGFQANPYPYMAGAELFVLSSVVEGFGNVLVEAMACGTPVVATDCPYGPREILDGGMFGELTPVGDVEALAGAMARALDKPLPKDVLIARARAFSAETAVDKYLDVIGLPRVAPGFEPKIESGGARPA